MHDSDPQYRFECNVMVSEDDICPIERNFETYLEQESADADLIDEN